MIIGLTHDKEGAPLQRLAISHKVAIGLPPTAGKNYPQKLDYFTVSSKNAKGDWTEDKDVVDAIRRANAAKGDKPYAAEEKVRHLDVYFLSDDIEDVFRTELAWWTATERRCFGDGERAWRSTDYLNEKKIAIPPGALIYDRYAPWAPCGNHGCKDDDCKPSGTLQFVLADHPVIGARAAYSTKSFDTIKRISSSLLDIQKMTDGRLQGIPLTLVLRPGKTRYKDDTGKKKSSNAFFVHIEFRSKEATKIVAELLGRTLHFQRTISDYRQEVRRIGSGSTTELVDTIADTDEEVIVGAVPRDAKPETPPATSPAEPEDDLKIFTRLAGSLAIGEAKCDVIFRKFNGEIDRARAFLQNVAVFADKLKPSPEALSEWIDSGIANPSKLIERLGKLLVPQVEEKKPERSEGSQDSQSVPPLEEAPPPEDNDMFDWASQ